MQIIAKNDGGSFEREPIPAGSYAARCYSMIQLGTNTENILGKDKELNKVRITWELPTELKVFKEENGEQPLVISKEFTLSMNEKSNLRKFLESWRGKAFTEQEAEAFDITKLIGAPCLISITHRTAKSGSVYANISSVSMLPKGMECPPQINTTQILAFSEFDQELFNSLPDFLRNKIVTSVEYKEMFAPNETTDVAPVEEGDLSF